MEKNRAGQPHIERREQADPPHRQKKMWLEGSGTRAYEPTWCKCARCKGEPRESERCVRTNCNTMRPHSTQRYTTRGGMMYQRRDDITGRDTT